MQDALGKRQSIIVAVAAQTTSAKALSAHLSHIGPSALVVPTTIEDALRRASALAAHLDRKAACVVIGDDISPDDVRTLVATMAASDVRVVLAPGVAAAFKDRNDTYSYVFDAGARTLDPHFLFLRAEARRESMGKVLGIAIRSPAGRRIPRPASTRNPFALHNHIDFAIAGATKQRFSLWARDAFAVLDALRPGATSLIEVTEIVDSPKADRLVCNIFLGSDLYVEVDLDAEMQGEGQLEVEVVMLRGSLICRWGKTNTSLTRKAMLRDGPVHLEEVPNPLEMAVRHALASTKHGASSSASSASMGELNIARNSVEWMLHRANERAANRPIELMLVHIPRYRNSYDELELPSLATARLVAFARGHRFRTSVVDLQISHGQDPLEAFTDDELVRGWLDGKNIPVITEALGKLWSSFGPDLLKAKEAERRVLVGFSIVDYFGHFQMNIATCLARMVKTKFGFPTVLGGERDQVDGDRALDTPETFDYVVDGDGEVPLLGLLHLEAYQDRRAVDIPGVWSRNGETVTKNKLLRSHLNAMPRPDFDDVDLRQYLGKPTAALLEALTEAGLYKGEPIKPFAYLPYGFVKGCTAKCEFCSAKEWLDIQSPEKSVDELMTFTEKYGVRDFMFLNNLVNPSPRLLEKFCRRLVDSKANIQWTDSCRPTDISGELAMLMRASGCLLLNYGAESGSDKILELMKKGLVSKDIVDTLRNTHRAGIINRVNFIAGYFHETEDDVNATIGLVETLAEEIDIVGCFQGFYLFPGMGVDAEDAGIVLRPGLDRLKTGQSTLAYDEIGGMKWEQKRDMIDASRNRILRRMNDLHIRTLDKINEYDLFWMSRQFDKATVTRFLLEVPQRPVGRRNQAALLPGGQRGLATARADGNV